MDKELKEMAAEARKNSPELINHVRADDAMKEILDLLLGESTKIEYWWYDELNEFRRKEFMAKIRDIILEAIE